MTKAANPRLHIAHAATEQLTFADLAGEWLDGPRLLSERHNIDMTSECQWLRVSRPRCTRDDGRTARSELVGADVESGVCQDMSEKGDAIFLMSGRVQRGKLNELPGKFYRR